MMKTAIDVVILPSQTMTAKAIEINRELLKHAEHKIILDQQTCLPHISLCMGIVEVDNLPKITEILTSLLRNVPPFELTIEKIRADIIPTGKKVSGLRIKDDPMLQKLQATIMEQLWPYLSYDEVTAEMFYNPSEIEDITFSWVEGYAKKHEDPSTFHPHITVGFGETDMFNDEFPLTFKAPISALCQLGNYCTARKVLHTLTLES